jgi:outer membrane protein
MKRFDSHPTTRISRFTGALAVALGLTHGVSAQPAQPGPPVQSEQPAEAGAPVQPTPPQQAAPVAVDVAPAPAVSPAQAANSVQAPQPGARRITLHEAVEVAVRQGPEISAAVAGLHSAEARVRAAGAQRFPKLRTEANLQFWDKPLEVSIGVDPSLLPPGTPPPAPLRVRDQLTWQFSATIAQPLTGLIALGRLMSLEEAGVNAARHDQQKAVLDTAQRASEAYLRLLQAKAMLSVSEQSVRQYEAQLERAQILLNGGVMQRVDVLRLTAARDNARHTALRAQTSVTTAGEALVLALNLPTGTVLDVVDDLPDPPTPVTLSQKDALADAKATRPEIAAARERTSQATKSEEVATAQLFPNIVALGTYQHTEGQSTFQPKNAVFIGGSLSWDIWDWGKSWQNIKEAEFRSEQSRIGENMLHDQIAFDVRRRLSELHTTYASLDVARSALEAAEEAYRIQSVSYREGGATTTDVLDTETEVSRARSTYAQARYEYYLATAGLARAVGQLPTARLGGAHAVR